MIARVIARRLARFHTSERIEKRLAFLESKEKALAAPRLDVARVPHYCSGCPHNTSTMNLPEGSRALGGDRLPLHVLVADPDDDRDLQSNGRRGRRWVGQAPFTEPNTFSPISATARTSIRGCWRSVRPLAAERSRSPTKSSTTMPSR